MIAEAGALSPGSTVSTVVCIVGAGAAGITLALELHKLHVPTVLVDAGLQGRKTSQEPYEGESNPTHPAPSYFRRRGFGGSTTIWGGRCVPFDPIDFERRDYLPDSGWPIAYDDVARHYPEAMAYCEAGDSDFDALTAIERARRTFAGHGVLDDDELHSDLIERYSKPTDFGRRYADELRRSPYVSVIGNAQCTRLNKAGERILSVDLTRPDKSTVRIDARIFVLATGGIETPRLLLASDPNGPGIGNQGDAVGRYYMCHTEAIYGKLRPRQPGTVFDFERTRDGAYCRRKLRLADDAQRQHGVLNSAFRLHFPDISDASHRSSVLSAVFLAKQTLIPEYRRILVHSVASDKPRSSTWKSHARNVVVGSPALARFGWRYLTQRLLADRKLPYVLVRNADGSFPLEFNAEQAPLRDSRLSLTRDRDSYGMPRVRIDWRIGETDIASACRSYELLADRLGPDVSLEFDRPSMRESLSRLAPVGGHHIGTARMSDDPRTGVVDRHCAVHGVPNLFIASSAVFPTSSHANPTLTIVALTLRLAGHIHHRLAAGAAA